MLTIELVLCDSCQPPSQPSSDLVCCLGRGLFTSDLMLVEPCVRCLWHAERSAARSLGVFLLHAALLVPSCLLVWLLTSSESQVALLYTFPAAAGMGLLSLAFSASCLWESAVFKRLAFAVHNHCAFMFTRRDFELQFFQQPQSIRNLSKGAVQLSTLALRFRGSALRVAVLTLPADLLSVQALACRVIALVQPVTAHACGVVFMSNPHRLPVQELLHVFARSGYFAVECRGVLVVAIQRSAAVAAEESAGGVLLKIST
jgi:hypothetical protein